MSETTMLWGLTTPVEVVGEEETGGAVIVYGFASEERARAEAPVYMAHSGPLMLFRTTVVETSEDVELLD